MTLIYSEDYLHTVNVVSMSRFSCSCCILILRFSYVENMLHFNLADYPVNFFEQFVSCLDIMKNIAYHFMEVLIFYTDKLMVIAKI